MFDNLISTEKRGKFLNMLFENTTESLKKVTRTENSYTSKTLIQKLNKLSEEYEFSIPDYCLYLFYNLGTFLGDFDAGYFYPPSLKEYFFIDNPKLENIINISKESTKLIKLPLLAIYETDRFAIPKLQLYEKGKIVRESKLAGKELYNPGYQKKDSERMRENFKSISEWINEIMKKD